MRSKGLLLFFSACFFLVFVSTAFVSAETMPGMDHDESEMEAPAGEATTSAAGVSGTSEDGASGAGEAMEGMDHEGYKPKTEAADDNFMALIAASVFGLPIAVWLVARSLKRAKKPSA